MIAARAQQVKPVGFRFLAVPLELVQSSGLSPMAILLFSVIADNARWDKSGSCKLTNHQLGTRINRSPYAVKRLLNELEGAGLLKREHVAEKRIRTAMFVTWVEQIQPTPESRPGASAPPPGMTAPPVSERERPTKGIPEDENRTQTENAFASDSREDKIELDPKPTPAEVAAAMRSMVSGRWSAQMFDGTTTAAPPERTSRVEPSPHGTHQPPAVASLARRVGVSAVHAAGFVRRDRRPPCPAPRDGAELARMRAARADILRDRQPFGGMANPGKM